MRLSHRIAPLCLSLLAAAPAAAPTSANENVLIILADDLGLDWVGLYGFAPSPGKTPNIDSLAIQGETFLHAWAAPMCSPGRALIQTGRHGFRTGIGGNVATGGLPLSELTLPELLDLGGDGIAHAFFGKWHLGDEAVGGLLAPNTAGWSHFAGAVTHAGSLAPGQDYFHWTKVTNGVAEMVDAYVTTVNVDDAIAWIGAREDPWVVCVSLTSVHSPLHAPPEHLHSVDLSSAGPPSTDPVPYFQAMIEAMDTEIGRLVAAVDPEDTTVIFASDNGTPEVMALPPFDPLKSKNSLFEGGLRVPLIVRGPAVTYPGSICHSLVSLVDVYATAAELAGIDLAATLPAGHAIDGISLVPYLNDPGLPPLREFVFGEVFQPNGAHTGRLSAPVALPHCQTDLGFAGPGAISASLCGEPLVVGANTQLTIEGLLPFTPVAVTIAGTLDPTPFYGGTLAAYPPALVLVDAADATGTMTIPGLDVIVQGPLTVYAQAFAFDAAAPLGIALSNALELIYPPWNVKTARNERYKLIADMHAGYQRLYDLLLDPLETVDLFTAGPLAPEAEAAAAELRAFVDALIAPE